MAWQKFYEATTQTIRQNQFSNMENAENNNSSSFYRNLSYEMVKIKSQATYIFICIAIEWNEKKS